MKLPRFGRPSAVLILLPPLILAAMAVATPLHALGVLGGLFAKAHPFPPAYPSWTTVHFVSAASFALLAFGQFITAFRSVPALHRPLGRAAVLAAAIMGVSGLAMAYLPDRPIAERVFMTTLFLGLLAMLVRATTAAVARDIENHRAWMVRLTATALTPMTQRLVFGALAGAIGIDGPSRFWELFVSAAWLAWLLNLTAAEGWLQRRRGRTDRATRPRAVAG